MTPHVLYIYSSYLITSFHSKQSVTDTSRNLLSCKCSTHLQLPLSLSLHHNITMGGCNSCEATAVAPNASATAKLITQDGKLLEFARPVKASQVLQKEPACFVCNSDDMEFDDFVSAVNADEELQPGQLYFLLPVAMLRRPLHADEIAALAVKASAALVASGSWHCSNRTVAPVEFSTVRAGGGPAATCGRRGGNRPAEEQRRRRTNCKRGCEGKGRNFSSDLTAIPE